MNIVQSGRFLCAMIPLCAAYPAAADCKGYGHVTGGCFQEERSTLKFEYRVDVLPESGFQPVSGYGSIGGVCLTSWSDVWDSRCGLDNFSGCPGRSRQAGVSEPENPRSVSGPLGPFSSLSLTLSTFGIPGGTSAVSVDLGLSSVAYSSVQSRGSIQETCTQEGSYNPVTLEFDSAEYVASRRAYSFGQAAASVTKNVEYVKVSNDPFLVKRRIRLEFEQEFSDPSTGCPGASLISYEVGHLVSDNNIRFLAVFGSGVPRVFGVDSAQIVASSNGEPASIEVVNASMTFGMPRDFVPRIVEVVRGDFDGSGGPSYNDRWLAGRVFRPIGIDPSLVISFSDSRYDPAADMNFDGVLSADDLELFGVWVNSACVSMDFNGDGFLNLDDFGDFITGFYASPQDERCDVNGDGLINLDDLSDFISWYYALWPCE